MNDHPLTPLDLPIPDDPMQRVRRLARDLAWGALNQRWAPSFMITPEKTHDVWNLNRPDTSMADYVRAVWGESAPRAHLLHALGYTELNESDRFHAYYTLTSRAFDLLHDPVPAAVFISYSRRESSAFALLVLARFKLAGLDAFLDMKDLSPGEDWHARLEREVRARKVFISLLGPQTLDSPHVREEIHWALQHGLTVIPVFHNGFTPSGITDATLAPFVRANGIVVETETTKAYNAAVVELLNAFGVSP